MFKWIVYSLIGIFSFAFLLFYTMPAKYALPLANQVLPKNAIAASNPQGTIVKGSIDISVKTLPKLPTIQLIWDMRFSDLLWLKFGLDIEVISQDLIIEGYTAVGLSELQLMIDRGRLGPVLFNQLLSKQGVVIQNPISFGRLQWKFDYKEQRTLSAAGNINWSGGPVSIAQPTRKNVTLPPVFGKVTDDDGALKLDVKEKSSNDQLMLAELPVSGWLKVSILKRVQAIVGMGVPRKPDDTLFEVQQKVF